MSRLLLVLALFLVLPLAARSEPPSTEKQQASPAEVARLIRPLGNDSFDEREVASKALEAIGEMALEALKKIATESGDAVCRRISGRVGHISRLATEQLHRVLDLGCS
jgi:histone H3/H4